MGNFQRQGGNPYSNTYNPGWKNHPNFSWKQQDNSSSSNPPQPQKQEKPNQLEEALTQFMKMTQSTFQNQEASIKNLENQIGQLSKQLTEQSKGKFSASTVDNPKSENCSAITLRSGKMMSEVERKKKREKSEVDGVEKERVEREKEVEREKDGVENESRENVEKEGKREGEEDRVVTDKLQVQEKPKVVPPYMRLPYPPLNKKKEKDEQFAKFMDIFKSLQINIPLAEALEQMPIYAKFMKELLTKKRKFKEGETVALTEECSAIIQRKLPPKMKDPGSFTIPCTIGNLKIDKALCDLGASINLMPLSMLKRLGGGEVKPTKMTLQLADRSIKYPYGIMEDVLVRVGKFLFPADFVILDMEEDKEVPLLLGRPFLATGRALIDVQQGKLILRFQDEKETFNVFEAMRHPDDTAKCSRIDVIGEPVGEILNQDRPPEALEKVTVDSSEEMFEEPDDGMEKLSVQEKGRKGKSNLHMGHGKQFPNRKIPKKARAEPTHSYEKCTKQVRDKNVHPHKFKRRKRRPMRKREVISMQALRAMGVHLPKEGCASIFFSSFKEP